MVLRSALAAAAALLLLPGCLSTPADDGIAPPASAEGPPVSTGAPVYLLGSCAAALDADTARIDELDAEVGRRRAERDASQGELAASQAQIAAAEAEARAARAAVAAAEARAAQARDAVNALTAAHGTALPPDVYARWESLRAAFESARADYEAAVAEYNAAAERQRGAVPAHNEAVERHNAAVAELNARERERVELRNGWHARLGACADAAARLPEHEAGRIAELERSLAEPASAIAGREAAVRCEGARGWPEPEGETRILGFVRSPEPTIHLSPQACHALHALVFLLRPTELGCLQRSAETDQRLCPPDRELLIVALSTVAHEAQHVAGELDEPRAECFGLQTAARVGEHLRLAPHAAQLAAWYAWRFPQVPESYRSAECRPGGALDRRPPGSTRWP